MKKLLGILFVALLLAALLPTLASAESSGEWEGLNWVLEDDGTLTIRGSGNMGDEGNDYQRNPSWISVPWQSEKASIQRVIIEEGVTGICANAFSGCSNLNTVTIPKGVKRIYGNVETGTGAFKGCSSLTNITLPDGLTSIGGYAFSGCSSLTNITIPDSVTSIGDSTFSGCSSLTSVTIPDSVTSIDYDAFYNCPAKRYASLGSEGAKALSKAFYGFRVLGNNYDLRYLYSNEEITGLEICSVDKDATSVTIPDSVTSISGYAFSGCSSLASVTIPDSVTSIGESSFSDCSSLTSVTIPDNVTSIGYNAFYNCPAKRYASLGSEGAKALSKAFYGFRVLGNNYDLRYLYSNEEITGLEICSVDKDATSVTIPDSVTSIGSNAFENCSSLTSITLPEGVTSIGKSAFYNCRSLTSITLPESVTYVDTSAFGRCPAILYADLNSNAAKILSEANYSFRVPGTNYNLRYNTETDELILTGVDSNAKDVKVMDGVTGIGCYGIDCVLGFTGCENLVSVFLPDSVTSIIVEAFSGCSHLMHVNIPDGVTTIPSAAFNGCSSLTSITLPKGMTSIGNSAFFGCSSLASITIPDDVTSIYDSAFSDCSRLTSITIPDGVTNIGWHAFSGCTNLSKIVIPSNVQSIGEDAIPKTTTIYCYAYTYADDWATQNGNQIVYLDDITQDDIRTVTLSESTLKMALGDTKQLVVDVFPAVNPEEIQWVCSNPTVASVADGLVTALNPGTTTITAAVGSASASAEVTVYARATGFAIPEEVWFVAKDSVTLPVTDIQPEGAENSP